jgi:hypothetical protein
MQRKGSCSVSNSTCPYEVSGMARQRRVARTKALAEWPLSVKADRKSSVLIFTAKYPSSLMLIIESDGSDAYAGMVCVW